MVIECNLSLVVRPYDFQALGEATSHPKRISTVHYIFQTPMNLIISFMQAIFVFLDLDPDSQTQIIRIGYIVLEKYSSALRTSPQRFNFFIIYQQISPLLTANNLSNFRKGKNL